MNTRPWINTTKNWIGASASIVLADTAEAERQAAAAADWRIDEPGEYCGRCGATRLPGEAIGDNCRLCKGNRPGWDRIVRLSEYDGPMGRWITAMKFRGEWGWSRWMGRELASRLGDDGGAKTAVCPVPMHWIRRWQRGFDQAQLMAETIAASKGWPVVSLLERSRFTPPQTSVPPHLRHNNVAKSFKAKAVQLSGWRLWLVDDVKTSGSTARACCRVLRDMGANWIGLAVAAVADSPPAK